jgi:hypothetical protein
MRFLLLLAPAGCKVHDVRPTGYCITRNSLVYIPPRIVWLVDRIYDGLAMSADFKISCLKLMQKKKTLGILNSAGLLCDQNKHSGRAECKYGYTCCSSCRYTSAVAADMHLQIILSHNLFNIPHRFRIEVTYFNEICFT